MPVVSTDHLHAPQTTVREQAAILARRLSQVGRATFRGLSADCSGTYEIVARFLALLELYREGSVSFDQVAPLGELYVTWVAGEQATQAGADPAGDGAGDRNGTGEGNREHE